MLENMLKYAANIMKNMQKYNTIKIFHLIKIFHINTFYTHCTSGLSDQLSEPISLSATDCQQIHKPLENLLLLQVTLYQRNKYSY